MRVYTPDQRELRQFGSQGVAMSPVARIADGGQVTIARIDRGGVIGNHPAPSPQILTLLTGEVIVRSPAAEATLLPGMSVSFDVGEEHETSARIDSIVLIVEMRSASREVSGTADTTEAIVDRGSISSLPAPEVETP